VTGTSDAALGDVTLVTNAAEYSTIMGEVLRAVQGKENKLFKHADTGKQLLNAPAAPKAQESMHRFVSSIWEHRWWIDQLKPGDAVYGLGYLVNNVDLPNGRKAGSGNWEGLTGVTGIISPADDVAIHLFQQVYHVADQASRHAQDLLESEFYRLHRS
jgi:CubicO group peptidase (beta-lactamase class C family)